MLHDVLEQIGFLSQWDLYAVLSLEVVAYRSHCNTVEWFWPTAFLQFFDAVGRVIWPIKVVCEMTYKLPSVTLSLYTLMLWKVNCLMIDTTFFYLQFLPVGTGKLWPLCNHFIDTICAGLFRSSWNIFQAFFSLLIPICCLQCCLCCCLHGDRLMYFANLEKSEVWNLKTFDELSGSHMKKCKLGKISVWFVSFALRWQTFQCLWVIIMKLT